MKFSLVYQEAEKLLTTRTPSHEENIYKTLCHRAPVVKSPPCSSVISVVKKSVPPWSKTINHKDTKSPRKYLQNFVSPCLRGQITSVLLRVLCGKKIRASVVKLPPW